MNEAVADPWIVQAPKQTEQVPIGNYMAAFESVEEYKLQDGSDKWRWVFVVRTGQHAGQKASALTNMEINANTHAGRLIAGLLGKALKTGDKVKAEIDACRGKVYLIIVQAGPKGGKPSVQSVGQPPQM